MRIGFEAKRLFKNLTGLGNYSRTTIDVLAEYYPGNELLLYAPAVKNPARVQRYATDFTLRQPVGLMRGNLWCRFGMGIAANDDNLDVFHGLSNELPHGLAVPSVVTIHDVAFHRFRDMYNRIDVLLYDAKWRHAIRKANRIIAISECTKRDIMTFYDVDSSKIEVVYQPVAMRYYDALIRQEQKPSPCDSPYMLYVGSVNSRKNLLGVVKALELLSPDLRIPLVVIGGNTNYMRTVMDYVRKNHLERFLILPDHRVDDEELMNYYRHAALFVYPSFYEGFGLPVVEAMLSGCPVVTSNVSSLPEASGRFSLHADPNDAGDIAMKMQTVLTDASIRQTMITGSREYALETFHPSVAAGKLMRVYEECCTRF